MKDHGNHLDQLPGCGKVLHHWPATKTGALDGCWWANPTLHLWKRISMWGSPIYKNKSTGWKKEQHSKIRPTVWKKHVIFSEVLQIYTCILYLHHNYTHDTVAKPVQAYARMKAGNEIPWFLGWITWKYFIIPPYSPNSCGLNLHGFIKKCTPFFDTRSGHLVGLEPLGCCKPEPGTQLRPWQLWPRMETEPSPTKNINKSG